MCDMTRALVAVVVLAACGSPPPPATAPAQAPPPSAAPVLTVDAAPPEPLPLDQDYPALAQRGAALMRAIAQAFATAGTDCAAATASLVELQATHADVIAANAKVHHEGRDAELRQALAAHAQELDAAARGIVQSPTMAACARDEAFKSAMDDLVGESPA